MIRSFAMAETWLNPLKPDFNSWHAGGQRFDPAQLHQFSLRSSEDCHVEAALAAKTG
jgi:hypothetical protein